ncbi:MAG: phosphoglucosamine mutase [Elusimicrobia bacterium]|nr:phosphoglucosamine mutase [Elusimicrobiota bacterium]
MRFFGTDGIRGVANKSPMTPFHIVKVGVALTNYFRKTKSHKPKILIGKDTRLSGYMLETSLSAGITAMGGEVFLVGPMPTPGIAFLTKNINADAGVVISASHNPYEDNGIKIFAPTGMKLSEEAEREIEKTVLSANIHHLLPPAAKIGKNIRVEDALGRYIVFLKSTLPRDFSLEGFKIILDCANGATYKVAPMIFSELRARVKSIGTSPDGTNINRNCGSLYPENLSKIVLRENADIGLAFDGDGDRLIPVDEKGKVVSGDEIIAIVADFLKERNELNNNFVVGTVMSNYGLRKFLDKKGIKYSLTPVGDRFVLEEMLRKGAILGGENSGHIIFLTHHTTGDGLLTALQLLSIMKLTGKKLSQLRKIMKVYPQVLLNIPVKKKIDFSKIPAISAAITRSEKKLSGRGRVLIRYSGTQMLLRIMVEGPLRKEISKIANDIKKTFQRHGRLS